VAASTLDDQADVDFDRLRPLIDAALARYVEFDNDCPSQLAEAIRYALLAPGKRLRPQLVLMAAEACGGHIETALPAGCAVEMVHAYSLVHDDLPAMDDDDLRRGRPTCHKVFGEALAILVGDALLARAFELLAGELQPPAVAARCCAVLARAAGACALVGGQVADLEAPRPDPVRDREMGFETATNDVDICRLESIHHRKTGALFVASLELGGLVAGGSDEQRAALASYGRNIGLAFQITDDLLDACGSASTVGKRVAKDADHGKRTYPLLLGIEESRRRAKALLDDACDRIEIFGPRAGPLRSLARFVCSRER
jgi:geranylgeranyl diphosphate synthase type II